jgi:phosphoserine phosphatase RsbU/P
MNFVSELSSVIAFQNDVLPSAARIEQIQAYCPLDLSSYFRALEVVGGDIWGVEVIGPQRVSIYVADFSGHGVKAALSAARFHALAHVECRSTDKPALLLERLNRKLYEVVRTGQFATMFCATIDFKNQCIEYASAGAPPQLYRRSSKDAFEVILKPSLPLGVEYDSDYESETAPFEAGGALVLYTDGLIGTPRPPHSRLSADGLRRFLNRSKEGSSSAICQSLVEKLFPGPVMHADDDITLAVVQHTGQDMGNSVAYHA